MLQNMYFITDSFRAVTLVIKRHHHSRYRRRFNSIFQVNLVSWFHSFSSACCRTTLTDMCHGFFFTGWGCHCVKAQVLKETRSTKQWPHPFFTYHQTATGRDRALSTPAQHYDASTITATTCGW